MEEKKGRRCDAEAENNKKEWHSFRNQKDREVAKDTKEDKN